LGSQSPVFWTDDEITYLIEHADTSVPEVAVALGRSIGAVRGMRERLAKQGRLPRQKEPYTEDELALLADQTLTNAEVAERTGRSRQVIAQSRWTRGIRGPQRKPKRPWTPEEIEQLVALHDRPTQEVAALLGRTVRAIQNQRYALLRNGRTPPRRRQRSRTTSSR
jgi:DNA-binding CsgD family transcriptional regulator